LKRRHVGGKAVFHVGLQRPLIGFVDFLNGEDFDIRGDIVLAAKAEHFLGFSSVHAVYVAILVPWITIRMQLYGDPSNQLVCDVPVAKSPEISDYNDQAAPTAC
jgi:hypothetical protein